MLSEHNNYLHTRTYSETLFSSRLRLFAFPPNCTAPRPRATHYIPARQTAHRTWQPDSGGRSRGTRHGEIRDVQVQAPTYAVSGQLRYCACPLRAPRAACCGAAQPTQKHIQIHADVLGCCVPTQLVQSAATDGALPSPAQPNSAQLCTDAAPLPCT